ncbi:MAG: adenylosuccinate synthase [Bacillota bacterium]
MPATAIVGANWGDEGKGKITDYLALESHVVVRFQGGSNAGHTVINDYGKFALHLLPSGVFNPSVTNILGPGVAVDIGDFLDELEGLVQRGVPRPKIMISDRAQVVMPYHKEFDAYEEERLAARKFGSTKSGMAPFYSDKFAKTGIQVSALYDADYLRQKVSYALEIKNVLLRHLYGKHPIDEDALVEKLLAWGEQIRPYVGDVGSFLRGALREDKKVLLEGQLGTLRDPDYGIYPFSTSSSTLAGYAAVGAGVPPSEIKDVIAVVKAYSSAVGEGPFVSELQGEAAEELRRRGGDAGEYGAKTGRPRRVGWFDAVATSYGVAAQGATCVALTNLDVLGYLKEIPVCVAYEVDGKRVTGFPVTPVLSRAKPVLETLPGWQTDIRGSKSFNDLPARAQEYVRYVERACGVPVKYLSVGPKRQETIEL